MIELRNVTKTYPGDLDAVNDFSLEIRDGETVVLIGASGCGKTTTLKMINRLIEPTSGEILIDSKNVLKLDPVRLRRDIGYVIQQIGLFPHMTIEENVTIVPSLLGWSDRKKRERAKELMNLVGLTPDVYSDRFPHELSGGQQQRIGVARALAADPPILLMDEPFGALDPITRRDIQDEFTNLKRRIKKTIVFVTHDIIEAVTLGERIAVMNKGKLIQLGNPREILYHPANPMVEKIIGHQRFQLTLGSETIEQALVTEAPTESEEFLRKTVREARGLLTSRNIDSLVVINENREPAAVLTPEALAHAKEDSTVEKAVSSSPFSIAEDSNLLSALNLMIEKDARIAPVTDTSGKYRGVLSRTRLLELINSIFDTEQSDSPTPEGQ